ncbi:hypothetical protein F8S20_29490, partial [Nostoc sp. BAE]|nr:hypothetical protein [Nostoc commune BAE]
MTYNQQHKQLRHKSRLGVEVLQGYNLTDLTEQQRYELKKSLWEHGVIVARQQNLTALQLKAGQTHLNIDESESEWD